MVGVRGYKMVCGGIIRWCVEGVTSCICGDLAFLVPNLYCLLLLFVIITIIHF